MTVAVFDSSVVVKWFVQDALSPHAIACQATHSPCAPAFLAIELANAFWKYERIGMLNPAHSAAALRTLSTRIDLVDDATLITDAHALTARLDHAIYDCLYVALAMKLSAPLITADKRLMAKLATLPIATTINLASVSP